MRMRTIPASFLLLGALASTAAAQIQVVQQTRRITGHCDVDTPSGIIEDLFAHVAPDTAPFVAADSAGVSGAWGASSISATQSSAIETYRLLGTGAANTSASIQFGVPNAYAFADAASEVTVTFDLPEPTTYRISGRIRLFGSDVFAQLRLRQGMTTHFDFQPTPTNSTVNFDTTGALEAGRYELQAVLRNHMSANQFYGSVNSSDFDFTFETVPPPHTAFCFGDGTGTACPCANHVPSGTHAGCLNSLGVGGRLQAVGTASLANDTLELRGTQMPSSAVLYFQGLQRHSGGAGAVFGDGKRCVSGTITRLGTRINTFGASSFPSPGFPSISSGGSVSAPGTRTYQAWYRNVADFCTPETFNLTNGVEVLWGA